MADGMRLEISGNALEKFSYASEHIDGWIRSAVGDKAHEFRFFAKEQFPRYLNDRGPGGTGTRESIQAWTPKRSRRKGVAEWFIRPGVRIPGMLNYLFKWVGTSRDFMNGSFRQWSTMARVPDYVSSKVEERFNALK